VSNKFGGICVSDAKRLRELEGENARLKRLLANAMLEIVVLTVVWCEFSLVDD